MNMDALMARIELTERVLAVYYHNVTRNRTACGSCHSLRCGKCKIVREVWQLYLHLRLDLVQ